jgi:hypothetical protein
MHWRVCASQLQYQKGIRMTTRHAVKKLALMTFVLNAFTANAIAQESAYADLDTCTKNEQIKLTVKGAALGAFAGLSSAFLSGNRDKAAKAAVLGAAGGGAIGFATAYYGAIDTCKKLNPSWVTESKLVRDPGKSYAQVVRENHYSPKDGITVRMQNMDVPSQTKAGTDVTVDTTYDVMTPDGAEAPVTFSRKLYIIADGVEKEMKFPQADLVTRTVEAGRSKESIKVPVPADMKAGSVYRIMLTAGAAGSSPVTISKNVAII